MKTRKAQKNIYDIRDAMFYARQDMQSIMTEILRTEGIGYNL